MIHPSNLSRLRSCSAVQLSLPVRISGTDDLGLFRAGITFETGAAIVLAKRPDLGAVLRYLILASHGLRKHRRPKHYDQNARGANESCGPHFNPLLF
jgi:hypothetical protein